MNDMGIPLVLVLLGMTAGAWLSAMIVVPASLCSLFRYRLWRLRDGLLDGVFADRLPGSPLVRQFIDIVEETIRHARRVTFLRWMLLPDEPQWVVKKRLEFVEAGFKELTEEQQELFAKHMTAYQRIILRHLILGTLVGWFVLALALLVGIFKFVPRTVSSPLTYAKQAIVGYGEEHIVKRERLWTFSEEADEHDHSTLSACAS